MYGGPDAIAPPRVRVGVAVVTAAVAGLSVAGSFGQGAIGSIAYVAALCLAALVILLVAILHPRQARAWRLVGAGVTIWAVGGFLVTLQLEAGFDAIPSLVISLCYTLGYLPLLVGLAELCDPQLRVRRLTNVVDGVLLFLVFYAVLWLTVVEPVVVDSSLPKLDRAFGAVYPAGDLAAVMLVVRIVTSRAAPRRVGALLLSGALLTAIADIALLALYLRNPEGLYPVTDLFYLFGLGLLALAAVWSLLPAPPSVPAGAASSRRLALMVAVSSLLPPLVLAAILVFTDRKVALAPVAVWILVAVGAAVMRHVAIVKELEQAHQQSVWLASHDLATDMLYRSAFLHEVAEGSLRERSGTVVVLEALNLDELRDTWGYEAVDHVISTMASRLRNAMGDGDGAVMARLAHDQLAVFMRSTDLASGRQLAAALQRSLATGVAWGDATLELPAVVGVAQADGAVIDGLAGVRRAVEAVRIGRAHGAGFVAVDADLTGSVDAVDANDDPSWPPSIAHASN